MVVGGAGVAVAPPSAAAAAAAEGSAAGAGVAKASEVHANPSGGQRSPEETETGGAPKKKIKRGKRKSEK